MAATPVASADALVTAIQKSGLLSADALERLRAEAAAAPDPKRFARDLIKDGTLTRWQAEQLLYGYHRLIVGKFKLLDQLATTPTGRLYLAEHMQMGRRHIVKMLAKRLAANERAVQQFFSAARAACGLDHRNISHVYDVIQDHERHNHYVVMEFVEGEDLDKLVTRVGRLEPLDAMDFLIQAAEGLAHAHDNGVVHGDLKPSNLLLDNTGAIKILEIGQAGTGATPQTDPVDESIEMAALGAVIFQPPELRGDGQSASAASDMYSLGSTLAFMLTGEASPDAALARDSLKKQSDLPPELIELCAGMMADNPADRPEKMGRVLEQLAPIVRQLVAAAKKANAQNGELQPIVAAIPDSVIAESAGKAKKPPVAKPMEVAQPKDKAAAGPKEAAPAAEIVIPGVTHEVIDVAPTDVPVIQTRRRKQPSVAKQPPVARPAPAADGQTPVVVSARGYGPIVLASAIGGGVVLVLGLFILVVCLLFAGSGSSEVATKAEASSAPQLAPQPEEAEANPVPVESNPEANPTFTPESNPISIADAPAEREPAGTIQPTDAVLVANLPSPPATAQPPAAVESPAATEPKPAAAEAAKDPPAKPEPEPAATASKPVAKPKPKPAAKPEPFKGLPLFVSLPALADANSPAATAAAVLGPCPLVDGVPVTAELLGGDAAVRGTRQKFELQPQPAQALAWNVIVTGAGEPATIATFTAAAGKLHFQWTDAAAGQGAVAKQLSNCSLRLSAGSHKHNLALRAPMIGTPLVVDAEKPATARWNIGDLPPSKQVFVEVTRVEGFKDAVAEPQQVAAGEKLFVWFGDAPKSTPLGMQLNISANARDVEIKQQPYIKLEEQEPRLYRRKESQGQHMMLMQKLELIGSELTLTKGSSPKLEVEKRLKQQKLDALAKQHLLISKSIDQITFATGFSEKYPGTVLVHCRVYYQSGDYQLDLYRTEAAPPPKKR